MNHEEIYPYDALYAKQRLSAALYLARSAHIPGHQEPEPVIRLCSNDASHSWQTAACRWAARWLRPARWTRWAVLVVSLLFFWPVFLVICSCSCILFFLLEEREKMQQSDDAFIRTYALEMLTDVNDQPYINKEKLFADSIAFYRWRLTEEEAEGSLDLYMHEFLVHHRQVVRRLEKEVWCACFITWFVEQGFHCLPPLTGFDPKDTYMLNTRFSKPSFRLPTGEPTETYLIQWVLWHLDNPLKPEARVDETQVQRWARELVDMQNPFNEAERSARIDLAARFFRWCRLSVRTWAKFMEYVMNFLYSHPAQIESLLDQPDWDLDFIIWFTCQNIDGARPSADKEDREWRDDGSKRA